MQLVKTPRRNLFETVGKFLMTKLGIWSSTDFLPFWFSVTSVSFDKLKKISESVSLVEGFIGDEGGEPLWVDQMNWNLWLLTQ